MLSKGLSVCQNHYKLCRRSCCCRRYGRQLSKVVVSLPFSCSCLCSVCLPVLRQSIPCYFFFSLSCLVASFRHSLSLLLFLIWSTSPYTFYPVRPFTWLLMVSNRDSPTFSTLPLSSTLRSAPACSSGVKQRIAATTGTNAFRSVTVLALR